MSIHTTARSIARMYGLILYFLGILEAVLWNQTWFNCGYLTCGSDWVPYFPWSIVLGGILGGLGVFIASFEFSDEAFSL